MRSDRIDTPSGVVLVAQQPAIDELEALIPKLEAILRKPKREEAKPQMRWTMPMPVFINRNQLPS